MEDPQQIREFADDITRRTIKNTDCSLAFRNCIEIANVPNSTTSCRHGLESRDADEDTDYFMRNLSSPSCRTAPTCAITITRPFTTQSTEPSSIELMSILRFRRILIPIGSSEIDHLDRVIQDMMRYVHASASLTLSVYAQYSLATRTAISPAIISSTRPKS